MTYTEIEDIVRWWGVLNLDELFDDKVPISLCLQAQIKYNETKEFHPQFMRLSIPLVVRVLAESKAYKRNYFVNYAEGKKPQITILNTKFKPFEVENLDEEANYTAQLASNITKEFDSLFADISNEEITFYGLGCLNDGTITLSFSK